MNSGIVKTESNSELLITADPNVEERVLLDSGDYAEALTASSMRIRSGTSLTRTAVDADQLIFVSEGEGVFHFSDGDSRAQRGIAILIRAGEQWSVTGESLAMLLFEIPQGGPNARRLAAPMGSFTRSVTQGNSTRGQATGNREFEVLFDASNGSSGATMFVGFIPPSGAPAHYHLYDEVCYIVQGQGRLIVGESSQPISAGSAFVVSPRLLHSLVNESAEFLWILGIFRPQGTPAAAYYPDGRPAPGYEEVLAPK
jgi:mannose-6-phosphate isomerase-like protein (cupin superfamily)